MPRQTTTRRRPAASQAKPPADQEQPRGQTKEEERTRRMRALAVAVADRRDQLEAVLAGSIDYERFVTVALQAVQSQPELLECTTLSLLSAIRDAATYGVEPAGMLGDAAIVKRGDQAHLELEYRGLRKLALRDGRVAAIDADVVYEKDEFRIESGTSPQIVHRPSLEVQRGNILGAYAFARFTNGELVHLWMPIADVLLRRQESAAWRYAESKQTFDSIWHKWPAEQTKKTVLRRLILEKLGMEPKVREALVADTLVDATPQLAATTLARLAPAGEVRQRLLARMGLTDPAPSPSAQLSAGANSGAAEDAAGRHATEPSGPDADAGATDSGRPGPSVAVTAENATVDQPKDVTPAPQPDAALELCGALSPYQDEGKPTSTCRKLKGHEDTQDEGARMHRGAAGETWKVEP